MTRMSRIPLLALSMLPAFAGSMHSQQQRPWQNLQKPSIETVRSAWKMPPPEYGPEPYYSLNGAITLDVVRRDLDTMKSLGFRAVTVQYGFGSSRAYLSPEYMSFFRDFVLEAKKRNMRVWIVDDAGYPSGFAGGMFTAEHPELRMQALVAAAKKSLTAGQTYDRAVTADTVAVTAINTNGRMIAVPFRNGNVHWTAPDGNWTVTVVEHAYRTSPTRSETNPNRVKDGSQSLEDYLDPTATAQYIAFTHEAYKKAVGDEFGKTILGFRGDEPDYSISGLPWTPKFFEAFQQKKGYDIRPYVAAFLQAKDVALTQEQLLARADYYDLFADLFRDGFFKPQADWCAANGLEYQVHLNHEEMELQLARSEGDFFRDMRYVQVPGVDSIWHQIWTDTISDFPRLASSAAHVYGHPRAMTETFAAYRPLPDVTMARYILNEQFVRGINLVEAMYFPSSTGGKGGPMEFMRDPAYPALMNYTARLSYLMSQGHPAADVALLLPAESLWMGDAKSDDTFVSTERLLSEHQVDFDIVDEDAIASLLPLREGAFQSASGNTYRTMLVPHASLLPGRLIDRLKAFAAQGGKVVFIGAAPEWIGGKTDLAATKATPADFAWATVATGDLAITPTPPAYPPTSTFTPQNAPAALLAAVKVNTPPSALVLDTPDTALRFMHRTVKDATVFLLFNEADRTLSNGITLAAAGHHVELWDPDTGTTTPVLAKLRNGKLHLPLDMPAYTTRVFLVR